MEVEACCIWGWHLPKGQSWVPLPVNLAKARQSCAKDTPLCPNLHAFQLHPLSQDFLTQPPHPTLPLSRRKKGDIVIL